MHDPTPPRTAVVISGGTAKGAYAAGYLTQIFGRPELASTVDLVSGTSTGSLIAPMLALHCLRERRQRGKEDLLGLILANYRVPSTRVFRDQPRKWWIVWPCWIAKRLFRDKEKRRMVDMLGMIQETGATLDTAGLRGVIEEQLTDERLGELIAGQEEVECLVNCVSAQSGNLCAFSTADPGMTPSLFRDAVYASCLQPVFMPLQEVGATEPRDEYMDGGIRDVVPVYEAVSRKASRVLAVSLNPDDPSHLQKTTRYSGKGLGRALALLLRVLKDLVMSEVSDDDLIEARQTTALGRLVLLARARGTPEKEILRALEPLNPRELELTNRVHPLADLHVHRPAPGTPLEELFSWTAEGMDESIEAGQDAAKAELSAVEEFLLRPPYLSAPAHSQPVTRPPPAPPGPDFRSEAG